MRYGDDRGSYSIVDLPGSPQVAVSIHSFVYPAKRGKDHGSSAHAERLYNLKKLGYDYVVCTVNWANKAEMAILAKNKWCLLDTFISSASGNRVCLYGKLVKQWKVDYEV